MTAGVFLTAEWRHLAMLNWRVDAELLRPLVPAGVELDPWGGANHVSAVGFLFQRTRVLGVSVPFHTDFEEVNLRFYVRREHAGAVRRGVAFVSELVPRPLVALVARTLYHEPYASASMSHDAGAGRAAYRWRRGRAVASLEVRAAEELHPLAAGTAEEFFVEHYFGYVRQPDGGTLEYEVEHPPWRVARGALAGFEGDAAAFYGSAFAEALRRPPDSALLAEGSPVAVRRGVRIA